MTTTRTRRALIVVDVQNDFVEGGSLPVTGGRDVASKIAEHLLSKRADYDLIVPSRDHHDDQSDNGGHFHAPGVDPDFTDTWPVHCVAGTYGAQWADEIGAALRHTADGLVSKGQGEAAYSAFEGVDQDGHSLDALLHAAAITDVDICGIATDYCVKATALDAVRLGFRARLLPGLHAGVAPETTGAAIAEMAGRGVEVAEGASKP
ncbi:isochorismatase family protein [Nocardioides sp.]|uniref:isochorismatase family protein n=1 Tax=Nocardioides sp. TaxID=35761 RepID=UPI002BE82AC6|nr:isochorismatase family protein [Nocardioides sp.]HXH80946.1 isochorismatase family protein [Nocardioides sp.]